MKNTLTLVVFILCIYNSLGIAWYQYFTSSCSNNTYRYYYIVPEGKCLNNTESATGYRSFRMTCSSNGTISFEIFSNYMCDPGSKIVRTYVENQCDGRLGYKFRCQEPNITNDVLVYHYSNNLCIGEPVITTVQTKECSYIGNNNYVLWYCQNGTAYAKSCSDAQCQQCRSAPGIMSMTCAGVSQSSSRNVCPGSPPLPPPPSPQQSVMPKTSPARSSPPPQSSHNKPPVPPAQSLNGSLATPSTPIRLIVLIVLVVVTLL